MALVISQTSPGCTAVGVPRPCDDVGDVAEYYNILFGVGFRSGLAADPRGLAAGQKSKVCRVYRLQERLL